VNVYALRVARSSPDPATVANMLTVQARAVIEGRFDQSVYPHRHLAVQESTAGLPRDLVAYVMAAVETLGRAGWELVSFGQIGDRTVVAVMRRR
jgi:hypothetical protein